MENQEMLEHYTESTFYEIELTAKYIKRMALNYFNNVNMEATPEEFLAIDVILLNPGICQRDLAKKLLKDRAGTGRVLLSLEAKGFIDRFVTTKGNRLVRNMKVTPKGEEMLKIGVEKLAPSIMKTREQFTDEDSQELKRILRKLRRILAENVTTQI